MQFFIKKYPFFKKKKKSGAKEYIYIYIYHNLVLLLLISKLMKNIEFELRRSKRLIVEKYFGSAYYVFNIEENR